MSSAADLVRAIDARLLALDQALAAPRPPSALPLLARHAERLAAWHRAAAAFSAVQRPGESPSPGV